jgi:ketosteroid isomerase-like protein
MPANLEIVRAAFDAYLRGDEEEMFALASPEIFVRQFPDQPDVRDFHGRDGLRAMMTSWLSMWEDWTIEALSWRAAGEHVFVTVVQRGRGGNSGAPMESEATFLFTVRDGLVTSWEIFHTEEEAERAADG